MYKKDENKREKRGNKKHMATSTFDKEIVLSKKATKKLLNDLYNSDNSINTSIDIAKVLHKNHEEQKKWLSNWEK